MEKEQKSQGYEKARKLIDLGIVNVFGKNCSSRQGRVLNAADVLKSIPRIKGWIARDRNKSLYFHLEKPSKTCFDTWCVYRSVPNREVFNPLWKLRLPDNINVPCKWEDNEPLEVELLINVLK